MAEASKHPSGRGRTGRGRRPRGTPGHAGISDQVTRNQAAIALLRSWYDEGNAEEQQADGAQIESFLAEEGLTDRRAGASE